MNNLLRNGAIGWAILSALWGAASIVYDICLAIMYGDAETISWQTQLVSYHNPVIPTALGFLTFGLAVHFFKIRTMPWTDTTQPIWYFVGGGLLGAAFVALAWTQRGP